MSYGYYAERRCHTSGIIFGWRGPVHSITKAALGKPCPSSGLQMSRFPKVSLEKCGRNASASCVCVCVCECMCVHVCVHMHAHCFSHLGS